MPLLSIEAVQRELGLKSRQSIYNLAKRGDLTIVNLPITGRRGVARIDSAQVDALKKRLTEPEGSSGPDSKTRKRSSEPGRINSPAAGRRRRPTKPPKPTTFPVMHFE